MLLLWILPKSFNRFLKIQSVNVVVVVKTIDWMEYPNQWSLRDGYICEVLVLQADQVPDEISSREIPKFDVALAAGSDDESFSDCHSGDLTLRVFEVTSKQIT